MSHMIENDVEVKSNARDLNYFVEALDHGWKKGAADFIRCGQLLIEAEAELSPDAFKNLTRTRLCFHRTVASKLMKIAGRAALCAHGHKLPPCWTTLYTLSLLSDAILIEAFENGSIHPGMSRADATALQPKRRAAGGSSKSGHTSNSNGAEAATGLGAAWRAASVTDRKAFLDKVGKDALFTAMSAELQASLRDQAIVAGIADCSERAPFALYSTAKLHTALRCAEQPEPTEEDLRIMIAALGCIGRKAVSKGITRSKIVIAEGRTRR